jgi:hypothetical protein
MSDLVPAGEIEDIVGAKRHPTAHYARAVSAQQTVYILHSIECYFTGRDLRECPFSLAMDEGIDLDCWDEDVPVWVAINAAGRLVPSEPI